ncbi:MAG: alpha/beta fold hydrolase [Aeromicrobium sp.]
MTETLEYAPGRAIDTYGTGSPGKVLIWHGRGPNERNVLAPLATAVADRGVRVFVPDWDSTGSDRGRADLLRSVKFARENGGDDPLVIVGWSLGGTAAASIALNARRLGLEFVPVVCLAGAFEATDPISGEPFESIAVPRKGAGYVRLVHGTKDNITEVGGARKFAGRLEKSSWNSSLVELPVDHAGIVGAELDAGHIRRVPSQEPAALGALEVVAGIISETAFVRSPSA